MKQSSRQITTILMVTLMVWTAITAFLPEISMFSFAAEEKSGAEATAPTPTETASKKTSKPLIRNKWKIVDGKWCYYNNKGVVKKRVSKSIKRKWVTAAGKKFYFSKKSKPVGQGFHMIKGKLYYMGKDRALVKGKFKYKGDKYKTTKAGNITGIHINTVTRHLCLLIYLNRECGSIKRISSNLRRRLSRETSGAAGTLRQGNSRSGTKPRAPT